MLDIFYIFWIFVLYMDLTAQHPNEIMLQMNRNVRE